MNQSIYNMIFKIIADLGLVLVTLLSLWAGFAGAMLGNVAGGGICFLAGAVSLGALALSNK
ncbi:MAG: hypothetical protein AB8B96_14750 [Lysobacterales bacterium]